MNIFATSNDPVQCAKVLDDKRVVKMCAESAQLLSTALQLRGIKAPCKITHVNHPVNVWVRSSRSNYIWLVEHFIALCDEKLARYPDNPSHVYQQYADFFKSKYFTFGNIGLTPFKNCAKNSKLGIDYSNISDVHLAYQLYLNDRWDSDKREPTWYGVRN